jgi:peroxiredoxin Q/BCP
MEGCGFRDLAKKFEKKNVVILGVSRDKPEDNAKFAKKNDFPFKLLSDRDGKISRDYGATMKRPANFSARHTYVISPEGKIEKIVKDVDPSDHAQKLLDELP